jgi:hypothetical protein
VPVGVDPALLPPPPPPEYIAIQPVDPGVYYVPIYDPGVVYGPWLWPAYQPFYWYPPGYVLGAAVIGFGVGFFVGSALWCHYNWGYYGGWHGGGPVTINVVNYNRFNHTNLVAGQNHWQFDSVHRGSAQFQSAALRQQFGNPKNFQNFQRTGTIQGNPQGTQLGNQGQFHTQGAQGTTQQGNQLRGGTNTKFNASVNTNTNVNTNTKFNANANPNAHFNTSKTNANANANVNRNQNQIQNQNVNHNLNMNRNFNNGGGGGNPNRGGNNFARSAGGGKGGGGGKGRDEHHH